MNHFEELIADVIKKYPSLSAHSTEKGVLLKGPLVMYSEYKDIPLYDEYEMEIEVPKEFPCLLPIVREVSGSIPSGLNHLLVDGSLCLASGCELLDFANTDRTIVGYIDKYIMNYLYTASYFSRYGEVPFGERSHGIEGIKEAYMERYDCENENVLIDLLCFLVGIKNYRGHSDCPCGSTKKLRDCHGKIILKDIRSELLPYYRNDAYGILTAYIEQRKKGI